VERNHTEHRISKTTKGPCAARSSGDAGVSNLARWRSCAHRFGRAAAGSGAARADTLPLRSTKTLRTHRRSGLGRGTIVQPSART
jgi:hypothetical protein